MDEQNRINGRKCFVFALCETAIFAIGYGVTLMFPQTSPYLWFGIGAASLIAAWVVLKWPLSFGGRVERVIEDAYIWLKHPFNKEKRFEAQMRAGWDSHRRNNPDPDEPGIGE